MKFFWPTGVVCVVLLAGCAGQQTLVPQVRQAVADGGAKTVTVAPEPLACTRTQCPVLAGAWSSAKTGLAVLTIGLPHQSAEVTGADFHFGSSQVVRVRSRSQAPAPTQGFPATAFDVPMTLVGQIAYAPRSWMRVYTADGRSVDETINSGEQRSRVVDAMHHFFTTIEAAGGNTGTEPANRGGLFDRLGFEKK
ncbi:MAG: hypothetical protein KBH33_12735 [Alicycliphilus sp.]|jgi:hypothetical protein|uniref:Lipoprotein n=1 Tax=Diaphorobacter limosus TaxID=3036128 RepID=A0ABZ0J611_9BURK|nr:hypothetical protein [Diaphorobacter sp. Y-1]MBP8780567.1 hypothetical protein [Alicycliphilus sp.]WOO33685.1 hypothetical protein P4826_06340 [Diaphorobacter sp. Y-1]